MQTLLRIFCCWQWQKRVTFQFKVHCVQCRMWRFSFRNTRLHRDTISTVPFSCCQITTQRK